MQSNNTGLAQTVLIANIESASWNERDQTFEGVLVTSNPVRQKDGSWEIIDVGAISAKAVIGLPVLDSHKRESIADQLGVIIGAKHEPGRLIITAHVDNEAVARRIKAGVLRSLSIGYARESVVSETVDPKTRVKTRIVRVRPFEASLVVIPADASATVRQQQEIEACQRSSPTKRRPATMFSKTNPSHSRQRKPALRFDPSSGKLAER